MAVSAISVVAGNNGSATVGLLYPQNVVIYARQSDGTPATNVSLTALLPSNPGGSFTSGSAKLAFLSTDITGHATLPTIRADGAVGNWVGTVAVSGSVLINTTFSMAAVSGVTLVPTAIVLSGGGRTSTPGQLFGPLSARVTDQFTNPMPGQLVTFTSPGVANAFFAGGATVATATTDSAGIALVPTLTSGPTLTTFDFLSEVGAVFDNSFLTTVSAGAATSISVVSGSNQYTPPSTGFLRPLVALVRNAVGTPMTGVAVTAAAPGMGASCTIGSNFVTNTNGQVSAMAIANATPGTYSVTMSIAGAPDAVFVLTNVSSSAVCTTAARPTGFGTTPYNNGRPWTNPEQILFDSPDGAATSLASGQISNILRGSTFGTDIPEGSTITGYVLTYKAKSSVAGGVVTPYLFVSGGFLTGTPVAQTLTVTMDAYQRGTSTDMWGNEYTVAQINGSAFSVAFIALSPSGTKVVEVCNVKLSVCYKTPQGLVVAATVPALVMMDF